MAKDEGEKSAGGSTIYRYQERERPFTAAVHGDGMEAIEAHMTRFFGEATTVLHEIVSDLVHIDVHVIPPAAQRPYWTLFTTGMSDLPMSVPENAESFRFAELLLFLPQEWRIDAIQATPPPDDLARWYWPIEWLKTLARFPHDYSTWLGNAHTMPNGDPAKPFAPETKLSGWMLLTPMGVADEACTIALDGRVVNLYVLHALHDDEMQLKLRKGADALLAEFERAKVSQVLNPDRPSTVRRKFLGLF